MGIGHGGRAGRRRFLDGAVGEDAFPGPSPKQMCEPSTCVRRPLVRIATQASGSSAPPICRTLCLFCPWAFFNVPSRLRSSGPCDSSRLLPSLALPQGPTDIFLPVFACQRQWRRSPPPVALSRCYSWPRPSPRPWDWRSELGCGSGILRRVGPAIVTGKSGLEVGLPRRPGSGSRNWHSELARHWDLPLGLGAGTWNWHSELGLGSGARNRGIGTLNWGSKWDLELGLGIGTGPRS